MVNPLKSWCSVGGLMQGLTLADGKTFGMESVYVCYCACKSVDVRTTATVPDRIRAATRG